MFGESFSVDGGGPQVIVAIIVVLILIAMVVTGVILLVSVGKSAAGYDTSVWSNKTSWGSALLGVGLIGLFTFGTGVVIGKSAGALGGLRQLSGLSKFSKFAK